MNRTKACEALGIGARATLSQARLAYRELIRQNHPDIVGATGTNVAVLLNQAIAAIETEPEVPEPDPVAAIDDALLIEAPPEELYARLAVALDVVGDLTYADSSSGYLEALVAFDGAPPSQLVVALQGRGAHTEAMFTLESMGIETPPDLAAVVRAIAEVL